MEWNRVWALGRDTYLRAYPNPGIGLRFGPIRVALSWRGGLEIFRRRGQRWVRTASFLSRIPRRP